MPIINMVYKKKKWWKPWANTIAYYPLTSTSTVNDLSGNNNTLTNQGATFWTYWGIDCVNTVGKSLYWAITNLPTGSSPRTISVWANAQASSSWMAIYGYWQNSQYKLCTCYRSTDNWWAIQFTHYYGEIITSTIMSTNQWFLITYTYDWTTAKMYVNWNPDWNITVSLNTASSDFVISGWWVGNETFNWYISNMIIENRARTAQEIADYYNQTKWNYGL